MKPSNGVRLPDEEPGYSCNPNWIMTEWTKPIQASPALDEIHVWRSSVSIQPSQLDRLYCLLSEDEKMRAAKYRFSRDCHRFIKARGLLRVILGLYLEIDPSQISFRYGGFGKPYLLLPASDLQFNITYSHEVILYAFSKTGEIGIDIEYRSANCDWREWGRGCFASQKLTEIERLPKEQAQKMFYTEWTRMEACLKAAGTGLSGLTAHYGDLNKNCYKSFQLNLGDDYAAALATPMSKNRLEFFDV